LFILALWCNPALWNMLGCQYMVVIRIVLEQLMLHDLSTCVEGWMDKELGSGRQARKISKGGTPVCMCRWSCSTEQV
jgi:hypothetical protein